MGAVARERLFLIDSFGFIFRAYHARARSGAPPMRTSTGQSTEAVYIFNNMLRKLSKQFNPPLIAAIFESQEPTLRSQEFADYKANRVETPPDLLEQIPIVRRVLDAMRIPVIESSGYEADDVIGTLARRGEEAGLDVVIVSSDKDMLQLVTDHVSMLNPAKDDEWYDPAKVKEFLGVEPAQVADLFALKGDAIDNIPGAPGIGDKGAKDLILRFGSVEAALERAAEVERKMYRESLQNNVERIRMSKHLATIATDVPVPFSLDTLKAQPADPLLLKAIYKEMEFHSLLKELGPGEDARPRDYAVAANTGELLSWLAETKGAPVAVAIAKSGDGEFALDTVGLAWRSGEARAVNTDLLPALKSWLEDPAAVKIACDAKIGPARPGQAGNRGARHRPRRDAVRLPARRRARAAARSKGRHNAGWISSWAPRPSSMPISRSNSGRCSRPRSTSAACASCTTISSCPSPVCWPAWNAPVCASTARS